jgi:hypothetical protein
MQPVEVVYKAGFLFFIVQAEIFLQLIFFKSQPLAPSFPHAILFLL